MKGLELLNDGAIAVAVDGDGHFVTHAVERGASDPVAAAMAALGRLPADPSGTVAVACATPTADWCATAVGALSRQPGIVVAGPAVASGVAAASAEAWSGAARGSKHVVFFGIAEHASAGILRDGVPLTGAGQPPAIAWLALNPVERDDYRRIGCLEAEVASAGIVRRLIWRIKAGDASRVEQVVGGELSAITLAHILSAARDGDGVALSVMRDTAKYLGMAAAVLSAIVHPEVVVLGGVMASAADLLFEPIRTEMGRRLPADVLQAMTIAPAAFGPEGPSLGATRLISSALR
jgi:glucokinase